MRILILLLFSFSLSGQITYFNSASTPTDNGTSGVSPITITPPGSMTTGDLVYVFLHARNATVTFANSVTGGQTWVSGGTVSNTNMAGAIFWCVYNGTWAVDPQFTSTTATTFTGVMHVFRPTRTTCTWAVCNPITEQDHAAAATITATGITTARDTSVTICSWLSADDNTWGTLTGSGWVVTGSAQYRNTDGTDMSSSFAHNIKTAAGATNNTSLTQLTLGNDAANTSIISFFQYEKITRLGNALQLFN